MSNFSVFKDTVMKYLSESNISIYISNLHEASLNDDGKSHQYLYNGSKDFEVISMDELAKQGYKRAKGINDPNENPINTVDAFLINEKNEWYLIEFKDCPIKADKKSTKDNIIKKAYANWYMLMDIFYTVLEGDEKSSIFDKENPVRFAKEHVHYILVCSKEKNIDMYDRIHGCIRSGENYTPPFMKRLKDYIFRDAYVYTEDYFEREFVKNFVT